MSLVIPIDRLVSGSTHDAAKRERNLSRLLVAYICAGLAFMLLPGTFLGVWNLFAISSHHSSRSISDAWVQAHGHAQVFGWIGCFILGIGFHAIPKMSGSGSRVVLWKAVFSLSTWTTGVMLRWFANIYLWHWRILLPVSGLLELAAFVVFFRAVSQHKPTNTKSKLEPWVFVVIAGSLGWLATLLLNLYGCFQVAIRGSNPAFPASFDQRFLVLMAWGFLVPHVWGFSAKWLPIFLGLRPVRYRALLTAVIVNLAGVIFAACGAVKLATLFLAGGAVVAAFSLRIFESSERPAKINGVHATFPMFVRMAYLWLQIAALMAIWAATTARNANGIWGASRHALTVGFIAMMVFSVGQRVLPALSGMKLLWSPRMMFANSALLAMGCTLRVASEVLAYQGFTTHAWSILPLSAVIEMSAVSLFAVNLILTFLQSPAHQVRLRNEGAASPRVAVS